RTVLEEDLYAAVNRDHPLARNSTLRLRALAAEDLISLPKGTGLRAVLDEACAAAGLTPRIAFEAGEPPVLAQLAAHGLGVAVLPESAARDLPDDLHAMPIVRPRLTGRIALAWRTEGPRSPAARALPDGRAAMPTGRPRLTGRIAPAWRTEGPRSPAARALMTRARHHLSPLP